ncbi:MAG TPA: ATP-binding protein [Phycisphaerae bacterium]|nr:ATP-binding protein [Phycisphaerae bacterium]
MSESGALELELPSDPEMLPEVREQFRQWALPHGWTEDQVADTVLAIDEALTNVIRHGYGGEAGHTILVSLQALDDPVRGPGLEVRIRDHGKQVDPGTIRGRDLEDMRPGGLGVHIIQSVMDSAEYSCVPGGGMQLVMRKYQRQAPATGTDSRNEQP